MLDFTRVLSGPYCTMILGDLGADILKIELPGSGDETRNVVRYDGREEDEDYFYVANRNKRSITIDLKHPRGLDLTRRLAAEADVVVENFSAGVMERLELAYTDLRAVKADIIYCSITGFSRSGPYHDRKSYDSIIQVMSGAASLTGERDGGPLRSALMAGDLSGALYATIGILAALHHRDSTGEGSFLEIPLLGSLMSLLSINAAEYLANGKAPERFGPENPNRVPSRTYRAGDGTYIHIMAATENLWESFCGAMGLEGLREDPRFESHLARLQHREEVHRLVEQRLADRPASEWEHLLNAAGVPCAAVRTMGEALEGHAPGEPGKTETLHHPRSGPVRVLQSPLKDATLPSSDWKPPPLLDEHGDEALGDWLDVSAGDLASLRESGALGRNDAISPGSTSATSTGR